LTKNVDADKFKSSTDDLMGFKLNNTEYASLGATLPTRRSFMAGAASLAASITFSKTAVAAAAALVATTENVPIRVYGSNPIPVPHRRALPLDAPRARYTGFKPGSFLLKKGTVRREGALPLPCDIVFERDVALKMRDGTTIYTDIFRPVGNGVLTARTLGGNGWTT